MAEFEVSKRHVPGERDDDGYEIQLGHFELTFDFGERLYRARIWMLRPGEASVTGPLRTADPKSQSELEAIARHLVKAEGISRVLTLSDPSGKRPLDRTAGFKPIELSFLKD